VIPHQSIRTVGSPAPVGQTRWSIVDRAQHAFCVESFVDEIAAAAHQDPLELRRRLLPPRSRERRVLDTAASIAEWGSRLPPRHGRGLSLVDSGESVTAEVVELSIDAHGHPLIHRVVAVVDDGEGISNESIWDAPGPGQPGRPPSSAAIANALTAAIGRRVRTLPL
jgi:isoquinoline 1-oxidoreductase beta subunit